jgi:hypothetical protein
MGAVVYLQVENPVVFAHIKDYDPEMSLTGYRNIDRYPTAATFTGGILVNF